MAKLRPTDWTAIKWYMGEFEYTIRDLMMGPVMIFRNKNDERVEVNINHIKTKYSNRPRKRMTNKVQS